MDLRQLRYFLAVVDEGGFTAGAEAAHVAQPSLSQAIRTLERELGADLFDRIGRSVRLTAAGEALVDPARQTVRDAATAAAAVAAVRDVEGGHLDLVCLPTLAVAPVSAYIGRFRVRHPQVTVRLLEPEDPAAVGGLVARGTAELGFTVLPVTTGGLVVTELGVQDYALVVPRGSSTAERVRLADLAALPLVTTPRGTATRRVVDEAFGSAGVEPWIAVETEHREVITELVRNGAGYSIVPRPIAERIARREATVVELDPVVSRRLALVHRDATLSPAGLRFLELVAAG